MYVFDGGKVSRNLSKLHSHHHSKSESLWNRNRKKPNKIKHEKKYKTQKSREEIFII